MEKFEGALEVQAEKCEERGETFFFSSPRCHSPAAAEPPAVTGGTVRLGENSLSVGGNLHDAPLVHLEIQCPSVPRRAFLFGCVNAERTEAL